MKKQTILTKIQKRLPDDIIICDETNFDFTDDECISILCWIKYFNHHYAEFGKNKLPKIIFPIISKRLRLDFGLYQTKANNEPNSGKYIIYITQNGQMLNGLYEKNASLTDLIITWQL